MMSCGMSQYGKSIYSRRFIGMPRYKMATSAMKNFALGVKRIESYNILIVGRLDLGVLVLNG